MNTQGLILLELFLKGGCLPSLSSCEVKKTFSVMLRDCVENNSYAEEEICLLII